MPTNKPLYLVGANLRDVEDVDPTLEFRSENQAAGYAVALAVEARRAVSIETVAEGLVVKTIFVNAYSVEDVRDTRVREGRDLPREGRGLGGMDPRVESSEDQDAREARELARGDRIPIASRRQSGKESPK